MGPRKRLTGPALNDFLRGLGIERLGPVVRTPTSGEGAEVGYRWFARTGARPMCPFGHGLSYTNFASGDLAVEVGERITASFTVTNTGQRDGADVPQPSLTEAAGERRMRLLGFERFEVDAGGSRRVRLTADQSRAPRRGRHR